VELPYDQEKELNIRLNKNVGEWDYDALANYFDVGELTEWGFKEEEIGVFEPVDISEQPRLDEKKPIQCPKCEYEFTT